MRDSGGNGWEATLKIGRLTLRELAHLPESDALEYLAKFPIKGGQQQADETDDEEEEEAEGGDQTSGTKDGEKTSGKDKDEKRYTKRELDAAIESVVKDRLARKERSDARKKAEEDGDKDKLIEDLKKEIDEDYKPKATKLEEVEAENKELRQVVDTQIQSILKDLPDALKDLDLGEDAAPTKRLTWLLEKVVPKKDSIGSTNAGEETKDGSKPGNKPNPKPKNQNGVDKTVELVPIVNKKRF